MYLIPTHGPSVLESLIYSLGQGFKKLATHANWYPDHPRACVKGRHRGSGPARLVNRRFGAASNYY